MATSSGAKSDPVETAGEGTRHQNLTAPLVHRRPLLPRRCAPRRRRGSRGTNASDQVGFRRPVYGPKIRSSIHKSEVNAERLVVTATKEPPISEGKAHRRHLTAGSLLRRHSRRPRIFHTVSGPNGSRTAVEKRVYQPRSYMASASPRSAASSHQRTASVTSCDA